MYAIQMAAWETAHVARWLDEQREAGFPKFLTCGLSALNACLSPGAHPV